MATTYFSRFTSHHTLQASSFWCKSPCSVNIPWPCIVLKLCDTYCSLCLDYFPPFFFLLKSSFSFFTNQMKYAFLTQSGKLFMISSGLPWHCVPKAFQMMLQWTCVFTKAFLVAFDFFEDWDHALLIKLCLVFLAAPGIWHVFKRCLINKGKGEWIEQYMISLTRRKLRSIEFKDMGLKHCRLFPTLSISIFWPFNYFIIFHFCLLFFDSLLNHPLYFLTYS